MAILNLPETARIIKKQKCAVQGLSVADYTLRSSLSPLAEITVSCDALFPGEINPLITALELARGVDYLELPYLNLSNGERYLVQEYRITPLVYSQLSKLDLTMVQQRSALVPENPIPVRVPHVPLYDSFNTVSFRNFAQQYNGGYQGTKQLGTWRKAERYWDVSFHLSAIESALLDGQLAAKRGIYPFWWSPDGDQALFDAWLCADWSIEYLAPDLHIFTGKFLYYGKVAIVSVNPTVFLASAISFAILRSYPLVFVEPELRVPAQQFTFIPANLSVVVN